MDHKNFLRLLNGEPHAPTIFEPFPTRRIVTQLIWRGGDELWSTQRRRTETLIEFYKYIRSDVVVVAPNGELSETLSAALPEGGSFVVISDDPDELEAAAKSERVCALATFGEHLSLKKPMIKLTAEGVSFEAAMEGSKGFDAVYLRSLASSSDRVILGGVGMDFINSHPPLEIYARITELSKNPHWAVGSGGLGEDAEYLGFISMLGMFNRLSSEYSR